MVQNPLDRAIVSLREDIASRVQGAKADGVVLGVSGGVDSAVVCALCAQATDTKALLMPDGSTASQADAKDGIAVCEAFGVPYHIIDLARPLQSIIDQYPQDVRDDRYVISNVKPRLRMTYLYMMANKERRLVAGTSNKTERILGYSTKWGDSAADFAPLGDVWKTDVFRMAALLGVPQHIIDNPPSARLWEGQTDEGELGGSYEQIDAILKNVQNGDHEKTACNDALSASLLHRIAKNRHKSSMPPFPEVDL